MKQNEMEKDINKWIELIEQEKISKKRFSKLSQGFLQEKIDNNQLSMSTFDLFICISHNHRIASLLKFCIMNMDNIKDPQEARILTIAKWAKSRKKVKKYIEKSSSKYTTMLLSKIEELAK